MQPVYFKNYIYSVPETVVGMILVRSRLNGTVLQSLSCVPLFLPPWTAAPQASLSPTISGSLPKFMSIASVMPSSHLILWCPLLLCPQSFPVSGFSNKSAVRTRWPKYWSFSFCISPSNKYSGLISLTIDWFDLLAVQGTFRSPLNHCSLKASILWCSPSLQSNSHNHTWPLGRQQLFQYGPLSTELCLCFLTHYLGWS